MPALFAYLLAVCIFLGGGYGPLDWLATPEPTRVTVSAKHTPPRSAKVYDATTHSKQANKHSPGKALELMTLRTIEFPDGAPSYTTPALPQARAGSGFSTGLVKLARGAVRAPKRGVFSNLAYQLGGWYRDRG
jgi:hypothetical protein